MGFKMTLKLTGLELSIEGDRPDEAPLVTENIGQQLSQLIAPASNIIEGTHPRLVESKSIPPTPQPGEKPVSGRQRSRRTNGSNSKGGSKPVELTHDSTKWGNPDQAWNPTNKAIWLLYVLKESLGQAELTAGEIAVTFNKYFKAYGQIRASNVSRDLSKSKSGPSALFTEEANGDAPRWSLTAKGLQEAIKLVQAAKTPSEA